MSQSLRLQGCKRDARLCDIIKECGVLNVDQICALPKLFEFKSGYRKASERLFDLYQNDKKLDRVRSALEETLAYFIPKAKPQHLDHRIALNWIYIYYLRNNNWTIMKSWRYEVLDYMPIVKPDAEIILFDVANSRVDGVFVEMDLDTEGRFEKVIQYNELYQKESYYEKSEWAQGGDVAFPEVLIVTVNEKRKKYIEKRIEKDNGKGEKEIGFKVKLLDDIKLKCLEKITLCRR